MSVEEDTELRDLVAQTLENNGTLGKIRAQLRASVFLALEEQESTQNKTPFLNKSLKEFLKTPEGSLATCLVREFLEYFSLDFTLSVFDAETYKDNDYAYYGREKLMKDLKFQNLNGKKGPLLVEVLHSAQMHNNYVRLAQMQSRELHDHGDHAFGSAQNLQQTESGRNLPKEDHKEFSSVSASALHNERTFSTLSENKPMNVSGWSENSKRSKDKEENKSSDGYSDNSSVSDSSNKPVSSNKKQQISGSKDAEAPFKLSAEENKEKSQRSGGSLLSSLGGLPPLTGSSSKKGFGGSGPKSTDMSQLKAIMDMGFGTGSLEAYDEDFHSSGSVEKSGREEKVEEKENSQQSVSEEIEEDLASDVDDLLNSNASGLDELTADATFSNQSGIADYMEDL